MEGNFCNCYMFRFMDYDNWNHLIRCRYADSDCLDADDGGGLLSSR